MLSYLQWHLLSAWNGIEQHVITHHCIELRCESKKTGPFPFEHSFGKYCQILIILSLLQTEINWDLFSSVWGRQQKLHSAEAS